MKGGGFSLHWDMQLTPIAEFQVKVTTLHDGIIDRWREHTVFQIVKDHRQGLRPQTPITASKFGTKAMINDGS